jgi:hypothetical protein
MLIYISYSPSDFKLFKLLRDQCEGKGFTIVTREKPFEFRELLTEKGMRRIELANVAVILLSSYGRSSYRVFQERTFIESIRKDHFMIEGAGKKIEVKRNVFEDNSSLGADENYHASLDSLEKVLQQFAAQIHPESFHFIYHTDLVY